MCGPVHTWLCERGGSGRDVPGSLGRRAHVLTGHITSKLCALWSLRSYRGGAQLTFAHFHAVRGAEIRAVKSFPHITKHLGQQRARPGLSQFSGRHRFDGPVTGMHLSASSK